MTVEGHVTRHDETALVRAWAAWQGGREAKDVSYLEFFDVKVRGNPRFKSTHVFEVLDVLVNSVEPNRRQSA